MTTKLNILLTANDYPVLYNYKSYLKDQAESHAEREYQRYKSRVAQAQPKKLPSAEPPTKKPRGKKPPE